MAVWSWKYFPKTRKLAIALTGIRIQFRAHSWYQESCHRWNVQTSHRRRRRSKTTVDIGVPTLSISSDVKPPTFDNSEVLLPEDELIGHPDIVDPLSLDEIRVAQVEDLESQNYATSIGLTKSPFDIDKDGVLVRYSPLYGARQAVIPVKLRERVVLFSHKPLTQRHPGETTLYQTLRLRFYWPFMAGEATAHVSTCRARAKAKRLRHKKNNKVKRFPPTGPLDDIPVDCLGRCPRRKTTIDTYLPLPTVIANLRYQSRCRR